MHCKLRTRRFQKGKHGHFRPQGGGRSTAESRERPLQFLSPGRNCSSVATAGQAAVLVDAAPYFFWLEKAFLKARRSILILGWDFDDRIMLDPRAAGRVPLGDFLRLLVERHAGLEVRVLMWSLGVIYGPGATQPMLVGAPWQDHPRIDVRLDRNHPIYGAQHQKIISVDDTIAFVGGMDLTVRRWDTCDHHHRDMHRVTPDGDPYPPVHDVQIAVDGEAAQVISDIARRRWLLATGETLQPLAAGASAWPEGLAPHFRSVPVGIACTVPRPEGSPSIGDAARLTLDAISRACCFLYIEAQYLTAARIEDGLAARLASPDCPEIVIVLTRSSTGLLERFVMGTNRDRLLRRLKRQDRHGRLRVYHPVVPCPEGDCQVKVHSKVIVADDTFLRVGSSNLNNRSVGLDSECDVAIEACDDDARRAIQRFRDQLLAEHLDTRAETVAHTIARERSMIRAIERLNVRPRGLRPFSAMERGGTIRPMPLTWLLDPERPFSLGQLGRWWRSLGSR